jgi:hypothetical protein
MRTCPKCGLKISENTLDGTPRTSCPVCKSPLAVAVSPAPTTPVLPTPQQPHPAHAPSAAAISDRDQFAEKLRELIHPKVALGLAIFFAVMAVISAVLGYRGRAEERDSPNWPTVPGVISSCSLREVRSKPRRLPYEIVKYTVDVTYDYSVDGESYNGDKLVLSDNLWEESAAQSRLATYAVGTTHSVYFNPSNPARAILEPGNTSEGSASVNSVMGIFLPLGLIPIVLLLSLMYWILVRRRAVNMPAAR